MSIEFPSVLIGLAIGSLLSYLVFHITQKTRVVTIDLYNELRLRLNDSEGSLALARERITHLSDQITSQHSEEKERFAYYESKIGVLDNDLRDRMEMISRLHAEVSEYSTVNKSLNEKLETQKQEIVDFRRTSMLEFEALATKILDEKTEKFTVSNRNNIENILKPLGEDLVKFKKQVEETYEKESKDRHSLADRVKELVETSQKLGKEANDLTSALKGQSKKQGNWGEMILESILDKSGLVKGREYFVQETFKDEEGKSYRPDVLIQLPENRNIIVDSKVSLNAYERFCAADEKSDQDIFIKDHLKSLRQHIDQLGSKKYDELTESLDFVMMFIPIEPAYILALQTDNELWHYAYSRKVLLISPTNLVAALKLISDLWNRENQSRHAQKIADTGAMMYDKFVGFVKHIEDIGKHIRKTEDSYNDAVNHLKNGRGNLINRALKLRSLGISSKKSIPDSFMPTDQLDDEDEPAVQLSEKHPSAGEIITVAQPN
jgi:DNA recombination protein RmuC